MARVNKSQKLFLDLAKAYSLWDICDTAYALLGNPVFVTDALHTVLAYTKCVEIDEARWQDGIVKGNLEGRTLEENEEVRRNHKASAEKDRPVLVPPSGPFKHSRIVRAIMDRGVPVGYIVDSGTFRDCDSDDLDLMEIISSFAKFLIFQKYGNHLENARFKSNFFHGLLDGSIGTQDILAKRMKSVCMNQSLYWYALVFAPVRPTAVERPTKEIMREISFATKYDAFVYDDQIVCIAGTNQSVVDWRGSYPQLHELVIKYELAVGVSRRFSSLLDARVNYIETVEALATGVTLGHTSPYMLVDDLALYRLFRSVRVGDMLSVCCSQKIRDLDAYDRSHRSDLCKTLQVYLENGCSLSRAAEIIFVHKNTVRYRIEKCMTLLFGSPDQTGELFSILMSLRILEYERKFLNR
jgi:hypothetical protein